MRIEIEPGVRLYVDVESPQFVLDGPVMREKPALLHEGMRPPGRAGLHPGRAGEGARAGEARGKQHEQCRESCHRVCQGRIGAIVRTPPRRAGRSEAATACHGNVGENAPTGPKGIRDRRPEKGG